MPASKGAWAPVFQLAVGLLLAAQASATIDCRPHNFQAAKTPQKNLALGQVPLRTAYGLPGVCYSNARQWDLDERAVTIVNNSLKYPLANLNYATADSYPDNYTRSFEGGQPFDVALNEPLSMNKILLDNLEDALHHNGPIPCGFLGQPGMTFAQPLSIFEHCKIIVATYLVADYDDLKPAMPSIIGEVCYIAFVDTLTLKAVPKPPGTPLESVQTHLGWYLYRITSMPYTDHERNHQVIKLLLPRLFPHARWSVYMDAARLLRVDPAALVFNLLIKQGADMAFAQDAFRVRTMDEAERYVRAQPEGFSSAGTMHQQELYGEMGFPHHRLSGLLTPTLMLRDHSAVAAHLASCAVFNEVARYQPAASVALFPALWWLGYRPCAQHEDFQMLKKDGVARLHAAWDAVSPAMNSRVHAFSYCDLSYATELYRHTRGQKEWRDEAKFECHKDFSCSNPPNPTVTNI